MLINFLRRLPIIRDWADPRREREVSTLLRPADRYTVASLHPNAGDVNQDVVDDILKSRREHDRELDAAIQDADRSD